jgi:RNA polymerase sigma factor (TIGR02999 family)
VPLDPEESDPPSDTAPAGEVTVLLARVRDGDDSAKDRLFELVYAELRSIARRELSRRTSGTLSATALVHEAFLKLERLGGWSPRDRPHFLALASRAMRQILVDASRLRVAGKRGGAAPHVVLQDQDAAGGAGSADTAVDVLAVHQALERLARSEPELARLVEWRFFGGFSVEEIAEATGVSGRTIKRNWRTARAFLYRELTLQPTSPSAPPTTEP